jgi:hypothetical protein
LLARKLVCGATSRNQEVDNQPSRVIAWRLFVSHVTLPLLELALVLVRLDHVASFIVKANYSKIGRDWTQNEPLWPYNGLEVWTRSNSSYLFLQKKCSLSASRSISNAAFIFIQLVFRECWHGC